MLTVWAESTEHKNEFEFVNSSVNRTLCLIASIWGALWMVSLLFTLLPAQQIVRYPLVAFALVASELFAMFALLRWNEKVAAKVSYFAVFCALINTLNVDQAAGTQSQLLTTTWLNSAVIVVAFLTPTFKVAVRQLVGILIFSLVLLILNPTNLSSIDAIKHFIILPAIYAFAVGMATAQAARSIRNASEEASFRAKEFSRAVIADARESAVIQQSKFVASLLHDTVINTLGTIGRGIPDDMLDAIKLRCKANLIEIQNSYLNEPVLDQKSISQLPEEIKETGILLGLSLQVKTKFPDSSNISGQIYTAALQAVRELLTNVSKHSGVTRAEVSIEIQGQYLVVSVSDLGKGWDGKENQNWSGLTRSVLQPCHENGGVVEIVANGNAGTMVTTSWPIELKPSYPEVENDSQHLVTENKFDIALKTSGWLLMLGFVEALLFLTKQNFIINLLALFLIGICIFSVQKHARSSASIKLAFGIWLAIVFVILLPMLGNDTCRVDSAQSWGVDAAAALIILVGVLKPIGITPWLSGLMVLIGMLIPIMFAKDSSGCIDSVFAVLPIEIGTIIAVHAFSRYLNKYWVDSTEKNRLTLALKQKAIKRKVSSVARTQSLETVIQAVEPFMQGVCDGILNPRSIEVQYQARQLEMTLRSLLLLDEKLNEVGKAVAEFVLEGFKDGHTVRVISGEYVPEPGASTMTEIREVLTQVRNSFAENDDIRVGIFYRNGNGVITVVVNKVFDFSRFTDSSHAKIEVISQQGIDETLLELSWLV